MRPYDIPTAVTGDHMELQPLPARELSVKASEEHRFQPCVEVSIKAKCVLSLYPTGRNGAGLPPSALPYKSIVKRSQLKPESK
jgi:hypothetical protein